MQERTIVSIRSNRIIVASPTFKVGLKDAKKTAKVREEEAMKKAA